MVTLAPIIAALSGITDIGLSFGNGAFFAYGVGVTEGSRTFTLDAFTAS